MYKMQGVDIAHLKIWLKKKTLNWPIVSIF